MITVFSQEEQLTRFKLFERFLIDQSQTQPPQPNKKIKEKSHKHDLLLQFLTFLKILEF